MQVGLLYQSSAGVSMLCVLLIGLFSHKFAARSMVLPAVSLPFVPIIMSHFITPPPPPAPIFPPSLLFTSLFSIVFVSFPVASLTYYRSHPCFLLTLLLIRLTPLKAVWTTFSIVCGSVVFILADTFVMKMAGRLLVGVGMGPAEVSLFRIIFILSPPPLPLSLFPVSLQLLTDMVLVRWFDPAGEGVPPSMEFAFGMVSGMGMLGGAVGLNAVPFLMDITRNYLGLSSLFLSFPFSSLFIFFIFLFSSPPHFFLFFVLSISHHHYSSPFFLPASHTFPYFLSDYHT